MNKAKHYYAVMAARIGGEDIKAYKIGPYASQYDPDLVRKVEKLLPSAEWNVLLVKRLHNSDFGRTPGKWRQDVEYVNSAKDFTPTPGAIYERLSGSTFLCLSSMGCRAVMQLTRPRDGMEKPKLYPTQVADSIKIYADGRMDWPIRTHSSGWSLARHGSTETTDGRDLDALMRKGGKR